MTDYHRRAFVCNHVLHATKPVLLVVHSVDDEWMLLCGEGHPNQADQFAILGIGHVLDRDPSLSELLDLGAGYSAERPFPGGQWARSAWIE